MIITRCRLRQSQLSQHKRHVTSHTHTSHRTHRVQNQLHVRYASENIIDEVRQSPDLYRITTTFNIVETISETTQQSLMQPSVPVQSKATVIIIYSLHTSPEVIFFTAHRSDLRRLRVHQIQRLQSRLRYYKFPPAIHPYTDHHYL